MYLDTAAVAALARTLHAGQVDKQGRDYFRFHVAIVAAVAAPFGDLVHQAASLHDVIEDCAVTAEDLLAEGVHPDVVAAVAAVSRDGDTYKELIVRAAGHPLGCLVKLADNAVNVAAGLLWGAEADRMLRTRYLPARETLAAASGLPAADVAAQVDLARTLLEAAAA